MTSDDQAEDARRVAAIRGYEALENIPRKDLQALVELAARVCEVPMATINLITADQQVQIATVGFAAAICSRDDSMCARVLGEREPVVVSDASQDDRWRDNPFVTGEIGNVRFYASRTLVTPEGTSIGTLCVFDEKPRTLTPDQVDSLSTLADRVVDMLELTMQAQELAESLGQVEQMRSELERSNEQLAAFAGQVSHDLRNPLASVAMSLNLLEEEMEEQAVDPMTVDLLATAQRGATRMQVLIEDLLAFARIGGELRRTPVDLGEVVAAVREDLAVPLAAADVEVAALPTVVGDRVQLHAVVQNLVANAAKFLRPGTTPEISIAARRSDDDAAWRVEIADRGTGVSAEDAVRAFEPLARLDQSVEGSGIGLATCRRVVEAHGGRIGLEPRAGGGTTAWFEIPD